MAAFGAAIASVCAEEAFPPEPVAQPRLLFFGGADGWRSGASGHGGFLWAPYGLDQDGPVLKVLAAGGAYTYRSGRNGGTEIVGQHVLGAVLPGWRLKHNGLEVVGVLGPDIQSHWLSPNDPDNKLRGTSFGVRAGLDLWYQPTPTLMFAANASVSSIGTGYWSRVASGFWALDKLWVGPEALAIGDATYRQWRAGLHLTGYRSLDLEWSAGAGVAIDSDDRVGPYFRIGILARR